MGRLIYLLDSNILSEPTKPRPNSELVARLRQHQKHVCTAAPVLHELRYGLLRLPEGQRQSALLLYLQTLLNAGLPVLPYDLTAAER